MPHQLLDALVTALGRDGANPETVLNEFWGEVGLLGTPLLERQEETWEATFLFREAPLAGGTGAALTRVFVEWFGDYVGGSRLELERLARTNLWWASVTLPDDFTGVYTFHGADRTGVIVEDIHEPWPMSWSDEYNTTPTHDVDDVYPANVVTTRSRPDGTPGAVTTFEVSTRDLPLPNRGGVPAREDFSVWMHVPAGHTDPLPAVVLFAGQFRESSQLERELDRQQPVPFVTVGPGPSRSGYTAWGWRNGYGPGELSAFVEHTLVPEIRSRASVEDRVHLVGWDYTVPSVVETALRIPHRLASITLLGLHPSFAGSAAWRDWSLASRLRELGQRAPGLAVLVEGPTPRSGPFSWESAGEQLRADPQVGLRIIDAPVTDPTMFAAAESLGVIVACAVRATSGR